MKLRYLLLIPAVLLALFFGGTTVGAEQIAAKNQYFDFNDPNGKGLYKIILPTEPEEEPLQEFQIQMEESWLPLLENRVMTASSYFVYDLDREEYLILSGQASDRVYPASITKLFTAYVALRYISADQQITIGSEQKMLDPDSSVAGFEKDDAVTVKQLVAAMMLPSGNDATYALTTNVGRILGGRDTSDEEAIQLFVRMMNIQAYVLGLKDSHFVTPDGIHDEDHYICLEDMITIAKLALAEPIIADAVGLHSMELTLADRSLKMKNTNLLLHKDSEYYCKYAVGLKTGYTSDAGNCLLTVCRQGQRSLLIGVFGCPDEFDRFTETLLLFAQSVGLETPGVGPVAGTIEQ